MNRIARMLPEIPQPTLNVLLGALIAISGTGLYNWNQRRIQRDNLRRALILEIVLASVSIQMIINNEGTLPHSNINTETFLPSKVYEANLNDIKILNRNEIEAVFQFYTGLELMRDRVSPYEVADPEFVIETREESLKALEELRRGTIYRLLRRTGLFRSNDAYET